jgi:hypothetical protein
MNATKTITVPELALLAGTRAALGAGVGLLLSSRLAAARRRTVGWTLFAIGATTTFPLARRIFHRRHEAPMSEMRSS